MYRPIPEKYAAHVSMPFTLHSVLPVFGLPHILTLANTLKPPLPLPILPTKPRPHAIIKHLRLAPLTFIGRLVIVCTIPVRQEGRASA